MTVFDVGLIYGFSLINHEIGRVAMSNTIIRALLLVVLWAIALPVHAQTTVTETYTYYPVGELVAVDRTAPSATAQSGSEMVRFQYDGDHVAAVYDQSGALLERYVNGPDGEVLAIISADGTVRYPLQDAQGSTVALTDASGAATAINAYDEYGRPRAGNVGRMQYTGQMWLPDAGVYHYRARAYHPGLGRFMQTDPVGYTQPAKWGQ